MLEEIFTSLDIFENLLWGYLGFPIILLLGIYLSVKSRFVQVRKFPSVVKTFFGFLTAKDRHKGGVHPLKAFFACVGGAVGVGNIVGICTAVQIGGPGALLWIWLTAIAGMMVKYAEVYLGMRYRISDGKGGYQGGPMYFLQRVFRSAWIPNIVCLLLCVYGVEVFQFSVVVNSITVNLGINHYLVIGVLLVLVFFAGMGGVARVGSISSAIIPLFVILYVGMGLWVLFNNLENLPHVFSTVFSSAFTGHAAIGGFIGSSFHVAISQGVRRACYTGDLGIGYASVIHSESSAQIPEKQASLVIFDIFLDTFIICTSSVLIILATDIWHQPIEASLLVQSALAQYFPYMHYFMPFFLFLLGYSTINAYFCVGLKSAEFVSPRFGKPIYYIYAVVCLVFFSFFDPSRAQAVMQIAGGLLLTFNCYGIYRLRHEISYDIDQEQSVPETDPVPVCEL
jgi:alanine or glycine:cation symporter, AGCS family